MVIVRDRKMVEGATFSRLKIATQSFFSIEEDNKTKTDDMLFCFFNKKKSGISSA